MSYASIPLDEVRAKTNADIHVFASKDVLAKRFASNVLNCLRQCERKGQEHCVVIMPVGPTGQWREMLNQARREDIDLRKLRIVSMDEYLLNDAITPVPLDHPLSFAAFIREHFVDEAIRDCGFQDTAWIAPDPKNPLAISEQIAAWGGVDLACAGIGLNGHLAFNEAPDVDSIWDDWSYKNCPTRIIRLHPLTSATNAIFGTGGDLSILPDYAITIGLDSILSARRIEAYLDWPWQCAVLRRSLCGPVTCRFPASYLQEHQDVSCCITEDVAATYSVEPE